MLDKAVKGPMGEGSYNEDMLSPKQKKFAALADPKDKITYADKIAGAKKKVVDENFDGQDEIENKGEYDQEGDMAADDLETAADAADELRSILDTDENLPEWVQAKITKAVDYLDTARDYMKSNDKEVSEDVYDDSVNKSKIPAFQRKAKGGDDWKVTQKDLDHEAEKNISNSKNMARRSGKAVDEGQTVQTKTGLIHKGSYGSDYQGSDGDDDDYDEWGNAKKKKAAATSDAPKKRGRPKKNTGPERVTSKAWKHKDGRVSEAIRLGTFVEDTMAEMDALLLTEKAKSKAQQKFMGMVHATQKGEKASSKEVAKAAKGMSKSDAKDFAKTKHKGLPEKVTEGIAYESAVPGLNAICHRYGKECKDFMTTGELDDDLFHALYDHYFDDMPYGVKKARDGDPYEWVADRFYDDMGGDSFDGGPDSLSPIPPSIDIKKDRELSELAKLAGLGEMDRSEYIQQQDAKAERAGRDHFNAFNQLFSTDEIKEGACNMTAEGEYCPEHGMNECGGGMMYEGAKPDFLDVDKDGDKEESMKDAANDKEDNNQINEIGDTPAGQERLLKTFKRANRFAGTKQGGKANYDDLGDKTMARATDRMSDTTKNKRSMFIDKVKDPQAHVSDRSGMMARAGNAIKGALGLEEDLQADDGEHYQDSDDFFGKFEADHFDKEVESDDGMEVRGYIDGVNVMVWQFDDESKTSGYGLYNDDMLAECGMPGSMGPAEQDSGMNINSSMDTKTGRKTLSVTADGEAAEQLAQMLKMAGLAGTHDQAHDHEGRGKVVLVTRGGGEEVAEDFANEPNQQYASTDTIVDAGQDLNRKKKQYADKPKAGDNPMATEDIALEGRLAALYNSLKITTK
jgi:hypothetical protein